VIGLRPKSENDGFSLKAYLVGVVLAALAVTLTLHERPMPKNTEEQRDYLITLIKKAEWNGNQGNTYGTVEGTCPWCHADTGAYDQTVTVHAKDCPAFFPNGVVRLEAP